MLRVGQLWRTPDPVADPNNVAERPVGIGAWGEGFVDRSLATLWYPGNWDEVGDDELVFLLPALSTWRPGRSAGIPGRNGPLRYLARTLGARALATAALISAHTQRTQASSPAQALSLLVTSGIVTALSCEELAAAEPGANRAPHLPARKTRGALAAAEPLPDWLLLEFTALAHLDRLLLDARGVRHDGAPAPLVDWPLALADAVLVTINARFNAAYVHPQFAHAQELLTAAALLGHMAGGRAAYLTPGIAQSLADLLSGREVAASGEGACASITRLYAELAGGAEPMLWHTKRARTSRRPHLVRPRPPSIPVDTGRTSWNARLLSRISERWHAFA